MTAGDARRVPRGAKLCTFAVVADTHVNEAEDRTLAPYATNALANARARHVMAELAALEPQPAFVVHLGDIVHPMPGVPEYREAAACFRSIAARLRAPLYLVPGNHDIGDKPVDWMPAEIVCGEYVELYRRTFGADWLAFDCAALRGLVIDTPLMNSGLPAEAEQRAWLERELAAASAAGRRIVVFAHYPPYVYSADERGSYDNLDEPARGWLLGLLRRHRVEALFAGHVHNFWYDVHGDTELYLLPSTAFLRHDYSEFYRVAPGSEFGRGDAGKFGYALVDVYEQGHAVRLVRTDGRQLAPDAQPAPRRALPPLTAKIAPDTGVGVELRHPWAEVCEIPSTGGVQEFGRKLARNDYTLMTLWEMGVRLLKLPEQDLAQPLTLERMRLMRALGHRYIVTALGVPGGAARAALAASPGLVDAIEINLGAAQLARDAERLARLRQECGVALGWARLRMHEDPRYDGARISHFVKTGTLPAELDDVPRLFESAGVRGLIDGLTVRLERSADLVQCARQLEAFHARSGLSVLGAIKLAAASVPQAPDDDLDTARLAAEALLVARGTPGVRYVFDTYMDVDRGYFARHGFIDRMYNPRPALRAAAALTALLGDTARVRVAEARRDGATQVLRFEADGRAGVLVAGPAAQAALELRSRPCADLCRGEWTDRPADYAGGRGLWAALD
jgi:hypothetical protein